MKIIRIQFEKNKCIINKAMQKLEEMSKGQEIGLSIIFSYVNRREIMSILYLINRYNVTHLRLYYYGENKNYLSRISNIVKVSKLKSLSLNNLSTAYLIDNNRMKKFVNDMRMYNIRIFDISSSRLLRKGCEALTNIFSITDKEDRLDKLDLNFSFQSYVIPSELLSKLKMAVIKANVKYLKISLEIYSLEFNENFQLNFFDWLSYNTNIEKLDISIIIMDVEENEYMDETEFVWRDIPKLIKTAKNIKTIEIGSFNTTETFLENIDKAARENNIINHMSIYRFGDTGRIDNYQYNQYNQLITD